MRQGVCKGGNVEFEKRLQGSEGVWRLMERDIQGEANRSGEGACANPACDRRDIRALGRCQACYVFLRRHGRDAQASEMRRRRREQPCCICGEKPARSRGRCRTCYAYWLRTGRERYVGRDKKLCRICQARPVYQEERCRSCYGFWRSRGRDRVAEGGDE